MTDESDFEDIFSNAKIKKTKFKLPESDFVNLVELYPCLAEKSQTPAKRKQKQEALLAMEKQIKESYGVNINVAQIKKKIENMRSRIKQRADKKRIGNEKIVLKQFEKKFLNFMNYENNPVLNKLTEEIGIPGTSTSYDYLEDVALHTELESISPHFVQIPRLSAKKKVRRELSMVLKLQREVLQQQKELNKQQQGLLALKKRQILLKMNVLNMQKNNLALEEAVLRNKKTV